MLNHLTIDLLVGKFEDWVWIILKFVNLDSGINLFHHLGPVWEEGREKYETGEWLLVTFSQSHKCGFCASC